MADNQLAADPFVNWTSDIARQHLLLDIARRFKGINPEVDARIDAHAELISGKEGIKVIPPVFKGEPRVPRYFEGEPGVGKTTLIREAVREFCEITGLNFVENPADSYQMKATDFYFFTVNLSGKNSPMDIGGLPSKGQLLPSTGSAGEDAAGDWLLSEIYSRARGMTALAKVQIADPAPYEKGNVRSMDVTIKGDAAQIDLVVNTLIRQVMEDVKKLGSGITLLKEGEEPSGERLELQIKKGTNAVRLTASAPTATGASTEYVAEMLPNRRFALATKTPFALVNFDDVANASESVRNVLLEVAQSNRYSGVMDIGNAMVTFTGNMGAEDNTNTQSEQSDAEVTRVFKARIRDTPKDWASRMARKYNAVGDCMFAPFIEKYGNQDGVFRDSIGDGRTARGIPKPNSRSLENALASVLPYFQMAKASNASPTMFSREIDEAVKGTAGAHVAATYGSFMRAMLTDAIPLADELLKTGALDVKRFEKHIGSETKSSEQDFAFRFAAALADSFVERISSSDEATAAIDSKDEKAYAQLLSESTSRLCTGLAQLSAGGMNYALSRAMNRMGQISRLGDFDGVKVKLNMSTYDAMAVGFADSLVRGIWANPEAAQKDFKAMVVGSNIAKPSKTAKAKP